MLLLMGSLIVFSLYFTCCDYSESLRKRNCVLCCYFDVYKLMLLQGFQVWEKLVMIMLSVSKLPSIHDKPLLKFSE